MKKFILGPKSLIVVLCIIAIVVIVQFAVFTIIKDSAKVAEGPCDFKSWSKNGSYIRLNLNCNGKEAWTEKVGVIIGYLAKPGPLKCSLWASGQASCQTPK